MKFSLTNNQVENYILTFLGDYKGVISTRFLQFLCTKMSEKIPTFSARKAFNSKDEEVYELVSISGNIVDVYTFLLNNGFEFSLDKRKPEKKEVSMFIIGDILRDKDDNLYTITFCENDTDILLTRAYVINNFTNWVVLSSKSKGAESINSFNQLKSVKKGRILISIYDDKEWISEGKCTGGLIITRTISVSKKDIEDNYIKI